MFPSPDLALGLSWEPLLAEVGEHLATYATAAATSTVAAAHCVPVLTVVPIVAERRVRV